MPQELVDGYGYPPVTDEIKRKILGENIARMHGIDIQERKQTIVNDEWSRMRASGKAAPWSGLRSRMQGKAA
jgi:hypothetical protein